jgi:hypothetical protein
MSDTTMEQPIANLVTLQRELEELAVRIKSGDRAPNDRPVQESGWGK